MTPKQYLEQARFIDKEISCKLRQLGILRSYVTTMTSRCDGMPRGETRYTAGISTTVARIVDLEREIDEALEREIDEAIDGLITLKRDILRAIDAIEKPELRLVLGERYLHLKPWREIAELLDCDIRTAHRYHSAALKEFRIIS